jgi:hypothetical protein
VPVDVVLVLVVPVVVPVVVAPVDVGVVFVVVDVEVLGGAGGVVDGMFVLGGVVGVVVVVVVAVVDVLLELGGLVSRPLP